MPEDEWRTELVRGEIVSMAPPGGWHGRVSSKAARRFQDYLVDHPIGEVFVDTGFIFARNPDVVRGPAVAFVGADRLPPWEQQETVLPLAPDLTVEVTSPSDRAGPIHEEMMDCLDAGTRLVWLVEPCRRTITLYHHDRTARILREGDDLDLEDVLPGCRARVTAFFP